MREFEYSDIEEINTWREARESEIIPDILYPTTGIFEPGIAAGFLNFTDTAVAYMENFVTNPNKNKELREKTIMEIVERLEQIAYDRGVKWLVAVTSHPKIESYIYKCKWERLPYSIFGKEL